MSPIKSTIKQKFELMAKKFLDIFLLKLYEYNFSYQFPVIEFKLNDIYVKNTVNSSRSKQRAENELLWEPELIGLINELNKNDVFLDVGACVGNYSIYAAKKDVMSIAIEPNFANSFCISSNTLINGVTRQVINLKVALSDFSSIGNLEFTKFPSGGNSGAFLQGFDHQIGKNQILYGTEYVEIMSIDQLTNLLRLVPKLIKIDTDKSVIPILNGGHDTLSKLEVEIIYIEAQSNQEVLDASSILLNHGFNLFKRIKFGTDGQYSNLIFRR